MKNRLFILLAQLFSFGLLAQSFPITGKLADAGGSPLPGAYVFLTSAADTIGQPVATGQDGGFVFPAQANGTYQLSCSFIGFQDLKKTVEVAGAPLDLGVMQMEEGVFLDEVRVTEKALPVLQIGDTTQYNATAYKTLPDASAEDLLGKMPTVNIENGKVQAQGEDVKRVLIDGKPFFGDDPTAVLRNLPAEIIDKIQIFDQQSEQAQFTGFDDGDASKTINIITKVESRNGQFGKIMAGYGYEDKYQATGNLNIFNNDQRLSLIGMSNNINQQNFAAEDLLGIVGSSGGGGRRRGGRGGGSSLSADNFQVAQQNGITAVTALGVNFTDKWGEQLEVAGSYFFNQSDNTTRQEVSQQFFDAEGLQERYHEQSQANSTNLNHRLAGRLNYTLNEKNTLIWTGKASWQQNDGQQTSNGQTIRNDLQLNRTLNELTADLSAFDWNNSLDWKHQFAKSRRTFSINLNGGTAPTNGTNLLRSENVFGTTTPDSTTQQQSGLLDQQKWNVGANFQYTEPLGTKTMLSVNYRLSYQQEASDKKTFDFNEAAQAYDLLNENLSNVFANDYQTQQVGTGLVFRDKKLTVTGRANVQWAQLLNDQTFPYAANTANAFWNVLPSLSIQNRASKTENLRVNYRTSTRLPAVTQLQNVLNNSNPIQLTAGNANLIQAYQHSFFARYSNTNTEKSSVFFTLIGGSLTQDYLASSTYTNARNSPLAALYDLPEGARITQPVNLNGAWNMRYLMTYGFPVKALQSNLNLDLSANYSQTPGLIDEDLNKASSTRAGIGLTLGSNISDRVDFSLASRSYYNIGKNTLQPQSNNNYFNQQTRLNFNWVLLDGLVFRTDLTHQLYNGLTTGFDQHYLLWNMSIGKKVFRDNRGEINLSVFDLLRQNNSLNRTITETYFEDTQTNVLQQYFMLSFKYDLRSFKAS
ncbi:MAG: TonB-dependent receptor [Bacteroidetes bacterium]|nr:MAG: TonB-dependent receptor [Bacteroidota bacterium]